MEKNKTELPNRWIWTTISQICTTSSGGTPLRSKKEYYGGNIPWIKSGELKDNTLIEKSEETITKSGLENSSAKLFPKGTILIAMYGATVGKTGILGIDATTNQAVCAIFNDKSVLDDKFLFYYLRHKRDSLVKSSVGAAQPNISQNIINNLEIPVPPLNEQNRIVLKIDELFSLILSTMDTLSKVKIQLKQYRQSILRDAFQGKITEAWRRKHKSEFVHAVELLEQIKKHRKENNVKHKEYPPETIPQNVLPDDWCWTTIGTLFDVKPGSTPSRQKTEYWNGTIPWVSSGEVSNCNIVSTQEKITKSGLENSSTKIHPSGTVLLAMIGEGKTRGKTAILRIPSATNQNVAAILCANSPILPEYIFWWLIEQYHETRRIRSGGMQYALNAERVKMLSIPLCSQKEQEEIVRELEYRISIIDNISKDIENHLFDLIRLQKTILQKAFSGKLVPQDPNDEPTIILLEKIKQKKFASH